MPQSTPESWADRLRQAGLSSLGSDRPEVIADAVESQLGLLPMARLLAVALGAPVALSDRQPRSLDERLWSAIVGPGTDLAPPRNESGPLTGINESGAIEVWTETELACVHGAWSLGGSWRDAAVESASWLLDNIQPDNATNHPWAIHVFAWMGAKNKNPEFDLYAQSLLHNSIVGTGTPDTFSALILLHAGNALYAG